MSRHVIIRPEAKQDLRAARAWYREISRDLADDFVRRADEALLLAQQRPLTFPIVHRTFRRVLLHRFPYSIFFHAADDRIVVAAVLHQARGPGALDSRTESG
jgi:plasmid stabilization system protein ParE